MTRSLSRIVGEPTLGLTIGTMALLCAPLGAQMQTKSGVAPTGSPDEIQGVIDMTPRNKLLFPYGVQTFEKKERARVDSDITVIPGWHFQGSPGMVGAIIREDLGGRPGSNSKRWLAVNDAGGGANQGFATPLIQAPSPWNYQWKLGVKVDVAPTSSVEAPTYAIQHTQFGSFVDSWAIRLTPTGAELFTTMAWGSEQVLPLFTWGGATNLGEWIDMRVVASLQKGTLEAFVNDTQVGVLRSRPVEETDVTQMRFAYHAGGVGNSTTMLLDDVGVAFLGPVCNESLSLTFTTEDDTEIALTNGQAITDPPEFGEKVFISGAGPNNGAAIFDSTPGGPNDPSQDTDLLIGQGNLLILQNDASPAIVGDNYPRANDDENGGVFTFDFVRWVQPLSIDVVDIDAAAVEGVVITLTDFSGLTRTFTVPANWTGDINVAGPGVGTLDLTTLAPQAGFASIATAVEDPGFDPNAVVTMTVDMGGSGALDNFEALIPCVLMDFTVEDDKDPVFAGTTMSNGQDLSTAPEFGNLFGISSFNGNHVGAAIFDSTPGGPNATGPDKDLLVGLGNICILQNNLAATQTNPGFFNVPNDDTEGGTIEFDFGSFAGTVKVNKIDIIDADEEESVGVTVTLEDLSGNQRVYTVPPSWTEDLLNDGPPAFRTLDLTTLANQPGFAATATATEDPGFDADEVITMTIDLGGAQAIDNICFCP
jgi:hypothetical protein